METIQNWFKGTAPDKEPDSSLLKDWKSYNNEPTAQALASAEEGTSTMGGILSSAISTVTNAATGAASSVNNSVQNVPGTTQWTYFAVLFGTGVLFLMLAFFVFLPVIILAPSKFAITFTLGSALILASLGALKGWRAMFGHMASKERLPFTAAYIGSLGATFYASLFMHSYILSLVCCVAQVATLVYYVASFFPGGAQGAQYVAGSMARGGFSMAGAVARGIFSK